MFQIHIFKVLNIIVFP